MVGLGDLPGGPVSSQAYDASQDGSVIVGRGRTAFAGGHEAFIWDAAHGMRSLQEFLAADLGLDLTGWHLVEARGISDDGLTIVGWGLNPAFQVEAWLVIIPTIAYWGDALTTPLYPETEQLIRDMEPSRIWTK